MTDEKQIQQTQSGGAMAAFGDFDSLGETVAASQRSVERVVQNDMPGGVTYTTFLQFGDEIELEGGVEAPWCYGPPKSRVPIHPDSKWVLDPWTYQHGYCGFEPDENGQPKKGQQPDEIFTDWNLEFPPKPDMKWAQKVTFKGRAVCVSSPIEGQVGAYAEFKIWHLMQEGFSEMEQLLRRRVASIMLATQEGRTDDANDMKANFYPMFKFAFSIGEKTQKYGKKNKPILEFVEWTTQQVQAEMPAPEPSGDEKSIDEAVQAKSGDEEVTKRRSRRRVD